MLVYFFLNSYQRVIKLTDHLSLRTWEFTNTAQILILTKQFSSALYFREHFLGINVSWMFKEIFQWIRAALIHWKISCCKLRFPLLIRWVRWFSTWKREIFLPIWKIRHSFWKINVSFRRLLYFHFE